MLNIEFSGKVSPVAFSSLEAGQLFMRDGYIYLKTSMDANECLEGLQCNAVNLSATRTHLNSLFQASTKVIPVKGNLTIDMTGWNGA